MDNKLTVELAPKFLPLFNPAFNDVSVWFLYGGRDSGKSVTIALKEMCAALQRESAGKSGRILAARSIQKNIDESMLPELRRCAELYPSLGAKFVIGQKFMRTRSGAVNFTFMGTNTNPIGLKGVADAFLSVVDEADALSDDAIAYLRPTIRAEGAKEIYAFNPTVDSTPMAKMFMRMIDGACGRDAPQNLYKSFIDKKKRVGVIFGTYKDNPFLSLASARRILAEENGDMDAEEFENIYVGHFRQFTKDAYYSRCLMAAEAEHRIDNYVVDYSLPVYTSWDLGQNDMMAVVVWQPVWDFELQKFKVFVIDFICGRGYPIDYYANQLNSLGYGGAHCFLPHDARQVRGYTETYSAQDALKQMGFKTTIIMNQGAGAAYQRIVKTRAIFNRIYLTSPSFQPRMAQLMECLQKYAPKIVNNLPTATPDHEFSDACDAFGIIPYAIEHITKPRKTDFIGRMEAAEKARADDMSYWGAGL